MRYFFNNNSNGINLEKLTRELREAYPQIEGIALYPLLNEVGVDGPDGATQEMLDDVQSIIDSHDPVEHDLEDAKSAKQLIIDNYASTLQMYENALANWDSLTPAQQSSILKRVVQSQYYVLKILKRLTIG